MYNNEFIFILPIKTHCLLSGISVRTLVLHQEIMLLQDFHVKIENNSHDNVLLYYIKVFTEQ